MAAARSVAVGALVALLSLAVPGPAADLPEVEETVAGLLETGRTDDALALLQQERAASTSAEDRVRLLWMSAWIHHRLGNAALADGFLREAADGAPNVPFPAAYGADLRDRWYAARQALGSARRREARSHVEEALRLLGTGQRDAGRSALVRALRAVPDQPEALYHLAVLDLEDGSIDRALAGFERLVALASSPSATVSDETLTAALGHLGAHYDDRGLPEEAEQALRRAVELRPDHVPARLRLGRILRTTGRPEESLALLSETRAMAPADAALEDEIAQSLGALGRWNEAAGYLVSATSRRPGDPSLHLQLGRAHRERGDPDGARRAFTEALRLDPDGRRGHGGPAALLLAALEWAQGRPDPAFVAARRATELVPGDARGQVYLGLGHEARGDLPAARDAFARAVDLDPGIAEAWANLARTRELLGDRRGAGDAWGRALALDPTLPAPGPAERAARRQAEFEGSVGESRSPRRSRIE